MEEIPVRQQLVLMKFRPCLDQTTLSLRKVPRDQLHGINRKDGGFVLEVRVEMNNMVFSSRLGEHSDDDAKEAAEFGHRSPS